MARYKQTSHLKHTDAAYIAGLIDGEGTITLSKRHKNENRQLVISISNNEKDILDYVLITRCSMCFLPMLSDLSQIAAIFHTAPVT